MAAQSQTGCEAVSDADESGALERRRFFVRMLAGLGAVSVRPSASASSHQPHTLRLQNSPLAGFQYHEGEGVWACLDIGAELSLIREPGNVFDPQAVRVEWKGRKLGYVPQMDNTAVAQMLDRGETLRASISELRRSKNAWERIRFDVEVVFKPRAA